MRFLKNIALLLIAFLTIATSSYQKGHIFANPNFAEMEPIEAKLTATCTNGLVSPADYLNNILTAPTFRPGHTLPRLGNGAQTFSFDTDVALADKWGYALLFPNAANPTTVANMTNPVKYEYKIIEKAKSDPERYPLQVLVERFIVPESTYPEDAWVKDRNGRLIYDFEQKLVFSPEAPANFLRQLAEARADAIRQISEKARIAIITHSGENNLSVADGMSSYAEKDPKVIEAKGDKSWTKYISERKAYQEAINATAIRAAVPDRQLYIYYYASGGSTRNYGFFDNGHWDYDRMRQVTDLPSESMYYTQFNNGYVKVSDTNQNDMLTQVLNATGWQIALGEPLSYNWVSGGWWKDGSNPGGLGPLDRYLGFLKMYYLAGQVGGLAGYYSIPNATNEGYNGFDACFDPNDPFDPTINTTPQPNSVPHWLSQATALSQAHALFSWLEPFLRNGDLVEGPNKNFFSHDQPAYELPSGFANTRVLARKLKGENKWLVGAWAADGISRNVTVTIDTGLNVTLNAIPEGRLYYVTPANAASPILIDTDPNNPSANAKILWDNNTLPRS